MDVTTALHITQKGEDEVKRRLYKLGMKKRSLLILLDKPQTVEHILSKSVMHREESLSELEALIQEGFISIGGSSAIPSGVRSADPAAAQSAAVGNRPPANVGDTTIHIDDEIVLSEAKFLLTNFSVDSFGTQAQAFVSEIRACKTVSDLRLRLSSIFLAAEKQCPQQIPALIALIQEINETA